ncbi:hypothetical protein L1987_43900 [Smallanthus sonchifolius]|uniref:Uncharacterized protein n=1 Tax=Smallanthus sonchifolius TaxID=185202 RepID=A0ACB9GNW6_9ASTR|nr:hypothetical protein L1987_43900 [Smallanthus sonchifolius]
MYPESSRRPPVGIWQEDKRRKNGMKRGKRHVVSTSYYVANLPEGTTPQDLEPCFQSYGRIADIYVAARKDKADGKPNNREERRNRNGFRSGVSDTNHQQNEDEGILENKGDKPFLQALLRNQKPSTQIKEITIPEDADYEVIEWYDKSVLGKALDLQQLRGLREFLTKIGMNAEDFVEDKMRWANVLSEVEIWKGQDYV